MKKIICLIIAISTLVLCLASCNSSTVQNECEITYHYYLDAQKTEEVSEEQLLAGQVYYLFVNYKVKHVDGSKKYSFATSVNYNDNSIVTCINSPTSFSLDGNIIRISVDQEIGNEFEIVYKIDAKSAGDIIIKHSTFENISFYTTQILISIKEKAE